MSDARLPTKDTDKPRPLPTRVEPLMALHFLVTRDSAQQERWQTRIEAIRQAKAIDASEDPPSRALLASRTAWGQMRTTGQLGATLGLGLGAAWVAWLIPVYAIGHGFGWLAALTYLLPFPLALKVGRSLWERASLAGMRELGQRPTWRQRLRTLGRSVARSFGAGFGFGFTLTFLQGLISWFMTPETTLIGELIADASFATLAGCISGTLSVALAPLITRTAPELSSGDRPALKSGD